MLNRISLTSEAELVDIILQKISKLREEKGSEKQVLLLVEKYRQLLSSAVVNLYFEEALTYQHLYMNDSSNKKALLNMQKSVIKAGEYINMFNLRQWQSRYFRFLGRIEDYKSNFKKSSEYYKMSLKYVKKDPDVVVKKIPRELELTGFLAFALIMSGKTKEGLEVFGKVILKFTKSKIGVDLKNKDFDTWVIWFSAVVINKYRALTRRNIFFNKEDAIREFEMVQNELSKKPNEYLYRKKEFQEIKDMIFN